MGTAPSERLDQSGRLAIKYTRRKSCVSCGLEFKQSSVGVIRKGMVINSSNCCGVIFGSAALGCECERDPGHVSLVSSVSDRRSLSSFPAVAAMQSNIGAAVAPHVSFPLRYLSCLSVL